MKKCNKTTSGKHGFQKRFIPHGTIPMLSIKASVCDFCGLIDDRPPKRKGKPNL